MSSYRVEKYHVEYENMIFIVEVFYNAFGKVIDENVYDSNESLVFDGHNLNGSSFDYEEFLDEFYALIG